MFMLNFCKNYIFKNEFGKVLSKTFFLIFESLEMIDFDRETCDRANFFGEDLARAFAARLGGAGDVPTGALRARALRALRARSTGFCFLSHLYFLSFIFHLLI